MANALTSTLAPALPFLLTASLTDHIIGETIPEEAAAAYRSTWQKILAKTKERPALLEAAENLAKNHNDPDSRSAFHDELRTALAADAAFFEDLKKETIHHFVYHHFHGATHAPANLQATTA